MIAFFDSGFGGLTIFKEVEKLMPEYDYLYLGDSARAPYGNHTQETVTQYAEEAVEYLFAQGARLIIFACNTASALALRHVQQKYIVTSEGVPGHKNLNPLKKVSRDRNILGVIFPLVEKATSTTKSGHIGVVGTRGTIDSKTYDRELRKIHAKARIFSKACPLLVPFIEEHWHEKPEARSILKKYLMPLKSKNVDTLILGCTHYPFMIKDFKRMMGKRTEVLNTGKIVAESLKDYLQRHPEIQKHLAQKSGRKFLTTGSPERFDDFAKKFLRITTKAKKICLIPIQ